MSLTKAALHFAVPLPKLESFKRYLFIGPHPDDIEIGAGALAAKLAAAAERDSIAADGEDLCFVNVSVHDADGQLVPRAKMRIDFAVEGPGEIVATDNGDETDFDDFRKPTRRAFNGWAQAIVRARAGQPGTIRVTAKGEGLAPAVVTVKVR